MSGRAAWIDALVTLDGWALADAELSTDRLQVRWARADDESAWAELRVTTPGHGRTAPRFRDLQVCDVHVRTHDGTPCPALDEVADGVVACIAARSDAEPHGGLVRWLGGQAVETDLTDAEAVHALLAPTWRPEEPLRGGWAWVDTSPRGDGGWVLEIRRDTALHHVTLVPRGEHFEVIDYRVAGDGTLGEARARVRLAVGLSAARGRVSQASSTPVPEVLTPILDATQGEHFEREGYLVVSGLVAPEAVAAARDAIQWFLSLDPTFDGRWFYDIIPYQWIQGLQRSGNFLEFYQHQALWDIRQNPAIHQVFTELWGRRDLWVSLDRVNMKPPVSEAPDESWRDPGFVHWDIDTDALPLPFGVQGLVALTDATEAHGTFHCAPGMHRALDAWAAQQPADRNPRRPSDGEFDMVPVPMKAGDLLVWHHGLPHGNGENRADDVRIVQYVSMFPAPTDKPQARAERIRAWRDRLRGGSHFEGDPLEREQRHGETATLTPLGRRLLGIEEWETSA